MKEILYRLRDRYGNFAINNRQSFVDNISEAPFRPLAYWENMFITGDVLITKDGVEIPVYFLYQ